MEIKKILNKRYTFVFLFLALILIYTYLYFNGKKSQEVGYSIVFFFMGLTIAAFYVIKDLILNPTRMNYRKIVMEQPLYNHKGKITKEVDAFPLHRDFVTLYLGRTSEDPYGATVTNLQSVRYKDNKMTDSLFIPIESSDPLLQKYTLSLSDAIAKFNKFAGSYPVVTYNHPFTHTYLNIKLDKEFTLSSLDAMKMSKDIYGLFNEPIKKISKHLHLHNLNGDELAGAKVVGAIYLDYMVTLTHYKNQEMRKAKRLQKTALKPEPQPKALDSSSSDRNAPAAAKETVPSGKTTSTVKVTGTKDSGNRTVQETETVKVYAPDKETAATSTPEPEILKDPTPLRKRSTKSSDNKKTAKDIRTSPDRVEPGTDPGDLEDRTNNLV